MTASDIGLGLITNIKDWLSDFVPYSAESWIGLLEHYNQSLWPYNLLTLPLLAVFVWAHRQRSKIHHRITLWTLALCWLWCGTVFLRQYYLTLNWGATLFIWLFLIQALLLLLWSIRNGTCEDAYASPDSTLSTVLLLLAVFSLPLIQFISGHSYAALGWPGLTPDATAILTVYALGNRTRFAPPLVIVPVVWSIFVFATSWPLNYLPGMLQLALLILVMVLSKYRGLHCKILTGKR